MVKDTILIGNDHGGYELKKEFLKYFKANNIAVKNIGSNSLDIVRYPYYAACIAGDVSEGRARRGILICSTGIGMSIFANRFKGVRAALCTSTFMAKMTRKHNDSNILCLGGKITGVAEALDILKIWLNTDFEGGRHSISLDLIRSADECGCVLKIPVRKVK